MDVTQLLQTKKAGMVRLILLRTVCFYKLRIMIFTKNNNSLIQIEVDLDYQTKSYSQKNTVENNRK